MISKSRLKYIQSLGQKKHRDEEDLFIAEGPKVVREMLNSPNARLKYLCALNEWIRENQEILQGKEAWPVSDNELERITQLQTPNTVLAVFEKFELTRPAVQGRICLVLDAIRDPGNLGTIIRIADWFDISHIICSADCADMYNSKVVQASMGSIARVKMFYTGLPEWLSQQTAPIYAALLDGQDVTQMDSVKNGCILIGNESRGVQEELLQYATNKITIPRRGAAESLNAAVATAIILSHLV